MFSTVWIKLSISLWPVDSIFLCVVNTFSYGFLHYCEGLYKTKLKW